MVDIWVVSDTHWNHTNIIDYCGRPFGNAEEMNNYMVERWNEKVKPQDKVYHLGDVYMGGGFDLDYTDRLLGSLHGHKRLILGNHDNGKDQLLQRYFEKIDCWRMFTDMGLLLTHVPVHESALFRGSTGNEQNPKKLRNIHGHIHEKVITMKTWKDVPDPDYKCVCVEHTDYTPVNIEDLRKW